MYVGPTISSQDEKYISMQKQNYFTDKFKREFVFPATLDALKIHSLIP